MELAVATPHEQLLLDPIAWKEWGQKLTLEQFAERERRLRGHAWAQDAMTTWVLKDAKGKLLSSCETFRTPSLVRTVPNSAGVSYALASALTAPELRGKGYMTKLLALLHERLPLERPDAQSVILYSDIGKEFYERLGYVLRPSHERRFAPLPGDAREGATELVGELALEKALPRLVPRGEAFLVLPTAGFVDWHIERERVYARLLSRRRPEFQGVFKGDAGIVWVANFKRDCLQILMMSAPNADDARFLLESARKMAAAIELEEVVAWEEHPGFPWPRGPAGGARTLRESELAMIRPLNPGVPAESWNYVPRALWV